METDFESNLDLEDKELNITDEDVAQELADWLDEQRSQLAEHVSNCDM